MATLAAIGGIAFAVLIILVAVVIVGCVVICLPWIISGGR